MPPYTGIGQYMREFELIQPEISAVEDVKGRKARLREELQRANDEKNELLRADFDPHRNVKATENAYHTLFVGRLSYDTSEKKLRREFEQYGPIKCVKMVLDYDGKPRGYAFIEFENEKDMTEAYKRADGKKLDERRILVDVERGRTVRNWYPRRFGGGLGGRKPKKSKQEIKEEEDKRVAALAASRSAY
ncbi:RNU1, partial [Symbiodinium microadriaticum]